MIELLKYMEHSTDEVSEVCKSERIQKMHRRICQIKASEKTEVKYMQSWEEKILIKQEGIAEGRLEGKLEKRSDIFRKICLIVFIVMRSKDASDFRFCRRQSMQEKYKSNCVMFLTNFKCVKEKLIL